MNALTFGRALVAALVLSVAAPAFAEVAPPKLTGSDQKFFKMRKRVAVPAYHMTYITQQQGTAVASIGARSRLNLMLEGVDEASMQALADEAHADLVGRFKAAGFDVLSQDEARALIAGLESFPRETVEVGRSITIGKSVKIGWTALGARDAPILRAYHNPASPTGAVGLSVIGANGKLGAAARQADAVAVIPALLVDFADMETKAGADFLGRPAAGVNAALRFGLRGTSSVTLVSAGDRGPGYFGAWRLGKDFNLIGPFATVQEGGAGVRTGSMGPQADSNYIVRDRARGDAVVVDLPVWTGLVRQAFQAYNAAVVAEAVKARG
ncbi:MAG: hypothetical protein ABW042_03285 [Phenylobacterium sp.]